VNSHRQIAGPRQSGGKEREFGCFLRHRILDRGRQRSARHFLASRGGPQSFREVSANFECGNLLILLANPTDGSLWMFQACLQVQGLDTSNLPNGSWGIVQAQPRDAAPRLEFARVSLVAALHHAASIV
jgi:hypothetical protein